MKESIIDLYTKKIESKEDYALIQILIERSKYQPEVISIAIDQCEKRGLLIGKLDDEGFDQKLLEIENDIIESNKQRRSKKVKQEQEQERRKTSIAITKKKEPHLWGQLPKTHVLDLTGYYSFILLVYFGCFFAFGDVFLTHWYWQFFGVSFCIPLWQGNILSQPNTKRSTHLNQRVVFSIASGIIISLKLYLISNKPIDVHSLVMLITLTLLVLMISGVPSLLFYAINIRKLSTWKWYFINRFRIFIPVAILFLIASIILEEGIFIKEKNIYWDKESPITFDDFRGYTDYLTTYDAAIHSYIDYGFDENGSLNKLRATCNTKNTWMNFWDRNSDSYLLLQHERYHFNITEVVTRMARKEIINHIGEKDKEWIDDTLNKYKGKLNEMQDKYDTETNHSIVSDMQGYWQFKIDSLLFELDAYGSPDILKKEEQDSLIQFYRKIRVNGKNEIVGQYELMPREQDYTDHYKVYLNKNQKINKVEHYFLGEINNDDVFKVASIEISYSDSIEEWRFYNSEHVLINNKYGIAKIEKNLDRQEKHQIYYNSEGERCSNSKGVFRSSYVLDSLGRKTQETYYDRQGQVLKINNIAYKLMYDYTKNSNYASSVKNLSLDNQPIEDAYGVHQMEYKRDSFGNILHEMKKGVNGQLVFSKGFAQKKRKFNELGYYTELIFLDQNGDLCEVNDKNAKITWSYDRYGNFNRESFYNSNNVLVVNENNVASTYWEYDKSNNLLTIAEYGSGDNFVFDSKGYGKVKYKYDSLNYLIEMINLDGYDRPIKYKNVAAITKYEWDSLRTFRKVSYYTSKYEPDTFDTGEGYFIQKYDKDFNIIENEYHGLDGHLNAVENDVAIFRFSYDQYGNKIESRYLNKEGQLAFGNQGVSIDKYTYAGKDRMVERSYYDSLENLICLNGIARIRWEMDSAGNDLEEKRFGIHDNLIDSGTAIIRHFYDRYSRKTESQNLNRSGVLVDDSIAITRYAYNSFGEVIEETFFDNLLTPTVDAKGVHKYKYYHGNNNQYLGYEYFNTQDSLTEVDGVAKIEIKRDARGNALIQKFYDANRNLTVDENGVFIYNWKYDDYDRIIEESFYDLDGLPMLLDSAYHMTNFIRDKAGHVTHKSFYDVDGELTLNKDSVALYVNVFNRNGGYTTTKHGIDAALKIVKL